MKFETSCQNYGIIFDMDGVIIDTCRLHEHSWFKLSELNGLPWDNIIDFKRDVFGKCSVDSAKMLFKDNITESDIHEMCTVKEKIYLSLLKDNVHNIVVPGFTDFLKDIVNSGITVGLATSSTREEAEIVLKSLKIMHLFKAVLDISMVANPKPHPEIYLRACEAIGMAPDNCMAFEDSVSGITALNKAGIKCMVVGTTLSYKRLVSSGLSFYSYINDYSEIAVVYFPSQYYYKEGELILC